MAMEYRLSYTAAEIDERLGKTDDLERSVSKLKDDIGNLDDLSTEQKENIVAAVNEALTKGGKDGKSAYQYAVDGGYTGTESDFAKKLASDALIVEITENDGTLSANMTYQEILEAIVIGVPVYVVGPAKVCPLLVIGDDLSLIFGANIVQYGAVMSVLYIITPDNEVFFLEDTFDRMPNPNAITFTGATTGTYDGSSAMTVHIPQVDIESIKHDIENSRFGDPYPGVDLTAKFADEIAGYSDPGAWIRARIRANNFDGIHVNDYIPFTTTNGLKFKARVAGIDPYYGYGYPAVGHHIDFICDEPWPTVHPINPVNYNNGLIPTENVTSDGTATKYVLTKPMYGVEKVTLSGTDMTGWTYDKDTYTLTFSATPAAGTMVVTGTGSEHPWLSCDAYLYANSLAGHVANGTDMNPEIKRVDYTNDGIYHYLPDWLKAVIIEKCLQLNKRYSTSGTPLADDNGWSLVKIGKLWFPNEVEVCGCPVWGSKGYGMGGSIQYPLFMGNVQRRKKQNGGRNCWWLLSPAGGNIMWCCVHNSIVRYESALTNWIAAPVCFRIG